MVSYKGLNTLLESIIDIECFLVFLGNGAFGFTRLAAFKSGR